MSAEIRAVIFDIDDTLYDRKKAQAIVFEQFKHQYTELFDSIDIHMLTTAYYEADRLSGEYFYASGKGERHRQNRFGLFLDMLELDNEYVGEMAKFYIEQYSKVNTPMAGAVEVVKALRDKYKLGVITNGLSETQRNKLDAIGLTSLFDSIVISDESEYKKPEPNIFWESAGKLACKSEQCIYIGNSYNGDIIGAAGAGMKSCWYNPSKNRPMHMPVMPDHEISKLAELHGFL